MLLSLTTQAQNKLYMNPVKYTDRIIYTYNHICGNQNQVHLTRNGQPFSYQFYFFNFGLAFIQYDFGSTKPGDVLTISDDCGSTPYSVVVSDDYVYVEVPGGQSFSGNSIPPGDETPPYSRLSTPVVTGRCEPITVGAHGLHTYGMFMANVDGNTIQAGRFLVNGSPIQANDHIITNIGHQSPVNYTIGANGGVTFDGPVKFTSRQFFSGQTPLTVEYRHNGADLSRCSMDLNIGAMTFRYIKNTGFSIQKATYTSDVIQTDYTGDYRNSVFKITYDGHYFRAYVDNVLLQELERFVVFSAQGGTVANTGVLPYGSTTTFTPTQAGSGWVGVLVDGVLSTRQQFSIADDLTLNPTLTHVSCSGAANGQISLATTGGKAPFQYNLNGGPYASSSTFGGLTPGTYTVGVRDASGCTNSRTVTITQPSALSLRIATQSDASCSDKSDGSISLTGSGGTAPYQFSLNGGGYGSSADFANLSAGTYTVSVRDVNGCVSSLSATVGTQSSFSARIVSQQAITCFGQATGSVSLSSTGTTIGPIQYAINGGAWQASPQFTGLSAGTYTVNAKDNLCTVSLSLELTQPTVLVSTVTTTQAIRCFGGANGQMTVSGSGGTPAYQYSADGSTYQSTATFSGLTAGNYKYWVKDANGCVASSSILPLSEPTALQLTVPNRQDARCFNTATGSATGVATGGTTPYTYARSGTAYGTSGEFTGLSAGNYTLMVQDANGCPASASVTIGQPPVLTGGLSSLQPVTCAGGSDGALSLSATGGTSPYRYARESTSFGAGNGFTGLAEGVYTLTVQDANGCTSPVSATIGYRSRLLPGATLTPVGCYGQKTGQINVATTGSTAVGSLLYSLDGTNFQSSSVFTGLAAGNYTIRLKDDLCQVSLPVAITQPTALSGSALVVQAVACWGGNSGLNRVSATGGTPPYQYSADGTLYQPGSDFSKLTQGQYTYWIKDANGCSLTTAPVSVTQPTALLMGVSSRTDVRCFDGADGVVSLSASGGSPGYRFALPSTSFQDATQFTGLRAGAYTAQVQDTHGCITILAVTVGQPQAPFTLAVTTRKSLTCFQDNGGQFTVAGSGGTGPYQYGINDSPLTGSNTFTGLAAGAYVLTGKDAQGCTTQLVEQTLTQPDQVVLSLRRKLEVDCEYYTRGEVQVSAVGGNGSFIFSLTGQDRRGNPITSAPTADGVFKALAAGNYLITARDDAGCTGDYSVAISARNAAIRFTIKAQPPTACGQNNGQLIVENASGGHPPYSYGISSQSALSANPQFDGLMGGSYLITVADSLCTYTQPASLTMAGGLQATYSLTPRDCRTPNADLQITTIQGGAGAYQFSLNNAPLTDSRQFTNLSPGIYALRIEDRPLSCATLLSLEILPQNGAGLRLTERQAVRCWNGSDGQLTVQAEANTGPFRYAVDGGSYQDNPQFTGLPAGWHRVLVQNRLGCLDSMRVLLTQPPYLNLAVVPKGNDCFGDQTGAVTASASGGAGSYQYSIDGITFSAQPTLGSLRSGTYAIRVRDTNGCITTQSATVVQPPLLTLQPIYADTVRCFQEGNGQVRLAAGGGTPAYRYSIDSLNYGADPAFGGLRAGTYRFWVQDSKQCRTQARITLSEPPVLRLSLVSQLDPLCYGDSSGKAQVLATGGNGGYTFFTDNGRGQPSGNFVGLTQSTYGFRVVDRRGCSDTTARIKLTWPLPLTAGVETIQPRCWGEANGTITVQLKGGTAPYQTTGPNWAGAGTPASTPVFAFTGLTAGDYTLPFSDSHGCRHQVPVTLEQPTALATQTVVKPNDCFGDQTGAITVTGQGAIPPYRYQLDSNTGQTTGLFINLRSQTYRIRVTDANGCQLIQSTLVDQPTAVTLKALYADTVRCFGESNGRVQLLAAGGVSSFRYAIDTTGSGETRYYADPAFGDLKAGPYTFWVKDQNGCKQSTALSVTEPQKLKLSLIAQTNPLCAGEANGTISVAASGGNLGYTYWLDNRLSQTMGQFTGLTQAEYTLKTLDRRGCQDTIRRVVLTWPKPLGAAIRSQPPRCVDDANGAISIQLTGGVGRYSGILSGTNQSVTAMDSLRYTNLAAGAYEVMVTDQNSCRLRIPVVIARAEPLTPIQLGDSAVVCKGQSVTLDSKNAGKQISWLLNGQPFSTLPIITATEPGLYTVSVKNATGC